MGQRPVMVSGLNLLTLQRIRKCKVLPAGAAARLEFRSISYRVGSRMQWFSPPSALVSALTHKLHGRRFAPALLVFFYGDGAQAEMEPQVLPPVEQQAEQLTEVVVKAVEPRVVSP